MGAMLGSNVARSANFGLNLEADVVGLQGGSWRRRTLPATNKTTTCHQSSGARPETLPLAFSLRTALFNSQDSPCVFLKFPQLFAISWIALNQVLQQTFHLDGIWALDHDSVALM
jgi:hypothetical protein